VKNKMMENNETNQENKKIRTKLVPDVDLYEVREDDNIWYVCSRIPNRISTIISKEEAFAIVDIFKTQDRMENFLGFCERRLNYSICRPFAPNELLSMINIASVRSCPTFKIHQDGYDCDHYYDISSLLKHYDSLTYSKISNKQPKPAHDGNQFVDGTGLLGVIEHNVTNGRGFPREIHFSTDFVSRFDYIDDITYVFTHLYQKEGPLHTLDNTGKPFNHAQIEGEVRKALGANEELKYQLSLASLDRGLIDKKTLKEGIAPENPLYPVLFGLACKIRNNLCPPPGIVSLPEIKNYLYPPDSSPSSDSCDMMKRSDLLPEFSVKYSVFKVKESGKIKGFGDDNDEYDRYRLTIGLRNS
jgi:hypothetical protein